MKYGHNDSSLWSKRVFLGEIRSRGYKTTWNLLKARKQKKQTALLRVSKEPDLCFEVRGWNRTMKKEKDIVAV